MSVPNPQYFKKGEDFEDLVQSKIFPGSEYDLLEKTHDYDQNKTRFVESTRNPDFKFRCKTTRQEFFVEVKYRSYYQPDDRVLLFHTSQFERFKRLDSGQCPVFVIVGIGGSPWLPQTISLLSIKDLNYPNPFKSIIHRKLISQRPYSQITLTETIKRLYPEIQPPAPNTIEPRPTLFRLKPVLFGLVLSIAMIVGLNFVTSTNKQPNTEKTLKSTITDYYNAIEQNNPEVLDYYLRPQLERWYEDENVALAFVKKKTEAYNKKYPNREIEIEWPTYKEQVLPNGDKAASYYLNYKIKGSNQKQYKTYYLHIRSIWDNEMKIRSMYEEKLN